MWRNTFLDNQSKETCADLINYIIQIQILCLYQWHLSRFLSWKCVPCLLVDLASVWVSIVCPDIVLGGKSAIVTLYTHYLSYEKIETNEKPNMQGTVRRPRLWVARGSCLRNQHRHLLRIARLTAASRRSQWAGSLPVDTKIREPTVGRMDTGPPTLERGDLYIINSQTRWPHKPWKHVQVLLSWQWYLWWVLRGSTSLNSTSRAAVWPDAGWGRQRGPGREAQRPAPPLVIHKQLHPPLTSAPEYLTIRILIESLSFSIAGERFLKSLYTFGNFSLPGIPVYIVIITPVSMLSLILCFKRPWAK